MLRKHLGFIVNLAAIGLFIPGIYLPIFNLNMDVTANVANGSLSSEIVNKELSLLGTIHELWQDERLLVAALIFIFSIAIPVLKTALVTLSYFLKNIHLGKKLVSFVNVIGKWSMADVFVIAIFLAVLSTNHAETATQQTLAVFGFKINVMLSSATLSNVGMGFYYFLSYCLLSMLGTQLSVSALKHLDKTSKPHEQNN
ncbi:paraquat-inducible protein A [Colwellia sp. 1_MG-2023]|uniref:paraquat-inducible protein A n=1 Tax=Colwellia sp. 1_MG-2023 TaxID=3062649 RepID=UPI0026E355AF|nr:paraquat-inducible protein A [Colwellia sp. 1_MG-2023]MDO6444821.1 paraquat-inducible protein A [Colwellia sp. 1_MG-2023]